MKFSIITPTYRRSDKLVRAVNSAMSQTYKDWEMIIVNDSPSDDSYTAFASSINDPRIHYHVNLVNEGVNFTRNYALKKISADSKWVIFLDDDDYLSPDTLQTFHDLILLHGEEKWFVTNRAYKNGELITQFSTTDKAYTYAWQYLILRRLQGDVTHCIETKLITQKSIRFLKRVKQGEEWFFFYQVGLFSRMFYHDHNSTITDGYDAKNGLNYRKRTISQRLETIFIIFYEGKHSNMVFSLPFIIYLIIRLLRLPYLFMRDLFK